MSDTKENNVKVYTGNGAHQGCLQVPAKWLGYITGHAPWEYGYAAVVAPTKQVMHDMLRARRLTPNAAGQIVRSMVMAKGQDRPTLDTLIEAGIIDTTRKGVYVWAGTDDGEPINRIDAFGEITTVGRFHEHGNTWRVVALSGQEA